MSYKITHVISDKVINRLGLKPGQRVHKVFMNRATEYMQPFLPRRSIGSVVDSLRQGIEYDKGRWHMKGHHIKYLFYGKLMVDPVTGKGAFYNPKYGFWSRKDVPKKQTDIDLNYTKTPNPQAGPRWDRAMMQSKGKQLTKEVQDEIKKNGG